MMKRLKIFLIILALYALLWLPGLVLGDAYLETPFGFVAVFPFLAIYIFHMIGIPWLLQNNGACGWGWCAPTPFGWVFLILFWLGMAYLASMALARPGGKA